MNLGSDRLPFWARLLLTSGKSLHAPTRHERSEGLTAAGRQLRSQSMILTSHWGTCSQGKEVGRGPLEKRRRPVGHPLRQRPSVRHRRQITARRKGVREGALGERTARSRRRGLTPQYPQSTLHQKRCYPARRKHQAPIQHPAKIRDHSLLN